MRRRRTGIFRATGLKSSSGRTAGASNTGSQTPEFRAAGHTTLSTPRLETFWTRNTTNSDGCAGGTKGLLFKYLLPLGGGQMDRIIDAVANDPARPWNATTREKTFPADANAI